jgi:hypothetical protein
MAPDKIYISQSDFKKENDVWYVANKKRHAETDLEYQLVQPLVDDAVAIVTKIAEWSRRYPRNVTYGISQIKMDNELIEIEELAKQLIPSPNKK